MHRHCFFLILGLLALGTVTLTAGPLTFAQFTEANGTNDFSFVNNGDGTATFDATSQVYFSFFGAAIPASDLLMGSLPNGPILATLSRTGTVTQTAFCPGACSIGMTVTEPIANSILAITDTSGDAFNGDLLLESSGSGATLTGQIGGSTLNLQNSDPPNTLVFSSAFINFATANVTGRSVGFTSVDPGVEIGADGLLSSFSAAGSGSFSTAFAPEPGSWSLTFVSLFVAAFWANRNRAMISRRP